MKVAHRVGRLHEFEATDIVGLLIDRYLFSRLLRSTLLVMFVFAVLGWLFALIDEAADMAGGYQLAGVLLVIGLSTPAALVDMAPYIALVGAVLGVGMLANSGELTAMRAAGWSVQRIAAAALPPTLGVTLVLMGLGETVAVDAEQFARQYKARLVSQADGPVTTGRRTTLRRGYWVREGDTFTFIGAIDGADGLADISQFVFDPNGELRVMRHADRIDAVATADAAGGSALRLVDVAETRLGLLATAAHQVPERLLATRIDTSLLTLDLWATPGDLPLAVIDAQIRYLERQGLDTGSWRLAWWSRVLQPLAVCVLVLLGLGFVFGPLRQSGMSTRVGSGVLAGLAYRFAVDLLGPASLVFGFPPLIAVVVPLLVCGVLSWRLLSRAA